MTMVRKKTPNVVVVHSQHLPRKPLSESQSENSVDIRALPESGISATNCKSMNRLDVWPVRIIASQAPSFSGNLIAVGYLFSESRAVTETSSAR